VITIKKVRPDGKLEADSFQRVGADWFAVYSSQNPCWLTAAEVRDALMSLFYLAACGYCRLEVAARRAKNESMSQVQAERLLIAAAERQASRI